MSDLNCKQLVNMMPHSVLFGTIERPVTGVLRDDLVALQTMIAQPSPAEAFDDQHWICQLNDDLSLAEVGLCDVMGVYALAPDEEQVIATGLCFVQCDADCRMADALAAFEALGFRVVGKPDEDARTVWLGAATERVADGLRLAEQLRTHDAVARLEVQALRKLARKSSRGSLAPPPG